MRTGPFSDDRVIALLRRYFVPVWLSSDEYGQPLDPADRAEWKRIARGNIMVYLIASDGTVLDRMAVTQALQTERNLLPMLEKVVKDRKVKPRAADAIRATAAPVRPVPGSKQKNGLVLHVWTNGGHDRRTADEWVELAPTEWATLAPPAKPAVGRSWKVPRKVVDRLYRHFYPAVCNYRVDNGKIESASLTITITAVSAKEVQLVLTGALQMQHDVTDVKEQFPGRVTADLAGVARYDRARQKFTRFQLASEAAFYRTWWKGKAGGSRMGIAVELVPPP